MACRRALNLLFRRNRPILFGIASSFIQYDPSKKPNANEKVSLEPPDVKNLSFDYMIKQSAIEAANSASTVLTVTYTAIEETSKEYRNLLVNLICLLQETQMVNASDYHWDRIVTTRLEMQKKKQALTQLVGYMEYVQKMAVAASEISFLSGMDNLSTTLCQRIDDAVNNVQKEVTQNQILEEEYTIVQEQCIVKSKQEAPETEIETSMKRDESSESETPIVQELL
ncbi:uncharacterized protein LOC117168277 isoform X1 [Belonocnema kinseyi]|uniref:uncharacterized protein LOC117168277 isoform X1 n=2 Tax=Belonocnema kinseyi TaxID=2817044 RepID=UPI00143CF52F|nr:uncharacterized protein LOC117168277 isoform X1 [Belonocnema kinseyi]